MKRNVSIICFVKFQADFNQSNHRTLQSPHDEEEENDESVDQVRKGCLDFINYI